MNERYNELERLGLVGEHTTSLWIGNIPCTNGQQAPGWEAASLASGPRGSAKLLSAFMFAF